MKLYIRQKIISWTDSFSVKDERGNDVYSVRAKLISLVKQLSVYSGSTEVARIQRKLISILPKFLVFVNGRQVTEIQKRLTFIRDKYHLSGLGWDVCGNILEHDYTIKSGGNRIATIHKKWMAWSDTYELDINDSCDPIAALAVIIAIDCVAAED